MVLVFIAPLMGLVALTVAASSPGGILFRQERIGLKGTSFNMYKFRSMVADAEVLGPFFTSTDDPRITPIGRILRRTSLDELPQLLNVIKGDMSLVGPRPDVPIQRRLYSDEEWQMRHSVRPGITGLAQATLRSEGTEDQRKCLDLDYVRSWSMMMDLRIIAMTVRQIILKGGN